MLFFPLIHAALPRLARIGRPRLPIGDPTYVNISFGAIGGMSAPVTENGGDATRVSAFIGLPYATPPTQDQRWKPPTDWFAQYAGGLRPAMFYGNACPQLAENGVAVGEEDCLYLNVWVPTNATNGTLGLLPILFFIHGGSCTSGAGSLPIYDGTKLALSQNSMVVTINYRLGPFGFLAMKTDEEQQRTTGNWGLLDQRSAMRWVQREAKAFGGDASRLTIFGESAGALSVCMHLIMPASAPLFASAILESRSCKALALADALGNATVPSATGSLGLANTSGCGAIAMHFNGSVDHVAVEECLRRIPSIAIFAAAALAPGWGPVVDGVEIADDPRVLLAAGRFSRVPIITGSNRDDGAMFTLESDQSLSPLLYEAALLCPFSIPSDACVLPPDDFSVAQRKQLLALYPARGSGLIDAGNARLMQQIYTDRVFTCPSRFLANTYANFGVPAYEYLFNATIGPGSSMVNMTVTHTDELPFVFGNFDAAATGKNAVASPANLVLSAQIGTFWRALAATGDPNAHSPPSSPSAAWRTRGRGRGVHAGAAAPHWPVSTNATGSQAILLESPTITVNASGLRTEYCAFWNEICPGGLLMGDDCAFPYDAIAFIDDALYADGGLALMSALVTNESSGITPRPTGTAAKARRGAARKAPKARRKARGGRPRSEEWHSSPWR